MKKRMSVAAVACSMAYGQTHDKMAPTRIRGQDMEKPKVVIDYNSGTGDVDLSGAYFTSYRSTRKRLKNAIKSTSVV
jgi:hypothetical protein